MYEDELDEDEEFEKWEDTPERTKSKVDPNSEIESKMTEKSKDKKKK